MLTKPLGTGILTTAAKVDLLSKEENQQMLDVMSTLNKKAALAAKPFAIHACTDITGFGLLGHAAEMAGKGTHTLEIWADQVPVISKAVELAAMGIIPAGAYRNRDYVADSVSLKGQQSQALLDVLFDPQTSGGLLFSVQEADGQKLLQALQDAGVTAGLIGVVQAGTGKKVIVK